MAKPRKPSEEKSGSSSAHRSGPELVPAIDESTDAQGLPELFGYGVTEAVGGGYLAYRVSNHGRIEIFNPLRNGKITGEKRHSALARMQEAIRDAYAHPRKRVS